MVKDNGVQLKTGIVLSYVQMFLSVIIGIIQSPIIIRCLGQSEYGLYNTIVSMLSMLTVLSLGFNSSYVRYYSIYKKMQTKGMGKVFGLILIKVIVPTEIDCNLPLYGYICNSAPECCLINKLFPPTCEPMIVP